jgi:hypothetical protein
MFVKSPASPGFSFFSHAGVQAWTRKFISPARAFRAHAEDLRWTDCDNSIVPLPISGLRVTFLAPVVLRGAVLLHQRCREHLREARAQRLTNPTPAPSARITVAQGYPEKQFRKTTPR